MCLIADYIVLLSALEKQSQKLIWSVKGDLRIVQCSQSQHSKEASSFQNSYTSCKEIIEFSSFQCFSLDLSIDL